MESSDSEPCSFSHVSLATAQMAPRKPSLSTSFSSLSTNDTSVPIRAPLTLDDESGTESNENESGSQSYNDELDSVTSVVSLSVSEFEVNEDDPDEDFHGFVDKYESETCNVGPFVGFCGSVGTEESSFNKLFVRPIAQLSLDEDGDFDNDHGNFGDFNGVDSEEDCVDRTETVVPSVTIVEKISVAPRVKGSENDIWGQMEEYMVEDNGDLGVLEDSEESNLKVDLGVDRICLEDVKIEVYNSNSGFVEACNCEETLASKEEDFAEKSSKRDADFAKLCVENVNTEENIGVLGDCEESLAKSEEKSWKVDAGLGKFCAEKQNFVYSGTNMVRSKSEESDVVNDYVEDEQSLVKTKEVDILVSSIDDFEAGRSELDLSVLSMSDQANGVDCNEVVEDLNEEIVREMEQTVAAFSRSQKEDSEDDSQQFDGLSEEQNDIKKIILLRLKFLKLVHRIGISLDDSKVGQVLDKLALGFSKETFHFCSIESTKKKALKCEAENQSDLLEFSLNILVLGKSGVGKSATINLIFSEKKAEVNAFEPGTTSLKEIVGIINGVKIRILDTPGLKVHSSEQSWNRKLLANISKRLRKFHPDIVLYVDRLDAQTTETDSLVLKSITASLGSSIWKNAIVTLTHSSSAPSDCPLGLPVSLKTFAARKLCSIIDSVGKANPMDRDLLFPVSLVENHPMISEDLNGRANLLLLCCSMKVLSEAKFGSIPERAFNWTEKVLGFSNCKSESHLYAYLDSSKLANQAFGDQISFVPRNETEAINFKTNDITSSAGSDSNVAAGTKIEGRITLRTTQCGPQAERRAHFELEVRDKGDLALSSAFLFLKNRFAIGGRGKSMVAGLDLATGRRPRIVLGAIVSDPLHLALVWVLHMVIFPVLLSYHGAQNQI